MSPSAHRPCWRNALPSVWLAAPCLLILTAAPAALAHNAESTSYKVINSTLDNGGGESGSTTYRLNGRLGGVLSGAASSSTYRMAVGSGAGAVQFISDTPSGSVPSITGVAGSGNASASVGSGAWLFGPEGNGPYQSAGFITLQGHAKSPAAPPPAGLTFPYGLFDFVAYNGTPGSTFTFTVTYPGPLPAGVQYWKYGPTPDNHSPHWYVLPDVVFTDNTATISIVDGQIGDDDLIANSMIVDQGGPGYLTTQAIPSLSAWALMLLSPLLAGLAWPALRRHRPGRTHGPGSAA